VTGSQAEIVEPVQRLDAEGGAGFTIRVIFLSRRMSAIRRPRIKTDLSMIAVWSADRMPAGRAK
jgi:hypothetical protein